MLLHQIVNRIHDWLAISREIDRVHRLDDFLLRDIGVPRKEIVQRVRGR